MVSPELLEILRCPWDPARQAKLALDGDRLVCERCRLVFLIKDGLPDLVDPAELPPGCESTSQLPCQRQPMG